MPLRFVNSAGPTHVRGGDLFAVFNEEPVIATAYWVSLRSRESLLQGAGEREMPYTPRNAAGLDLTFEEEESGTYIAGEVFYTDRQMLEDDPYRSVASQYTEVGVLLAKRRRSSCSNLTSWGRRMVNACGSIEGRSINAGVRMRL